MARNSSQAKANLSTNPSPKVEGRRISWQLVRVVALLTVAAVAGGLYLYRLFTFVPEHLDSPRTLRYLLFELHSAVLSLSGGSPDAEILLWHAVTWVAVLVPPALVALGMMLRRSCPPWLFGISLAVAMLVLRFPAFLKSEINADEGEFLAVMHGLFGRPFFWAFGDAHTSGPLNVYQLGWPALFGYTPDYASSRIAGVAWIWGGLLLLYRTFKRLAGDEIRAQLAVLPVFACFASFRYFDTQHNSSESAAFVLYALALYTLARLPWEHRAVSWILGLLTCTAYFAKMQSAPVLAAVFLVVLAHVWRERQVLRNSIVGYAGGAGIPYLLHFIACASTGVAGDFWMSYVTANAAQVAEREPLSSQIINYGYLLKSIPEFNLFAITGAILVLLGATAALRQYRRYCLVALSMLGAALLAIFLPARGYPHYLLLLMIPAGLATGVCIVALPGASRLRLGIAFAVPVFLIAYSMATGHFLAGDLRGVPLTIRSPDSLFIEANTPPASRIMIWGWTPYLHLASGRRPVTRDSIVVQAFSQTPAVRNYYRQRIAGEIAKYQPDMFVDVVHKEGFVFKDPERFRFEVAPEVAAVVFKDYRLLASIKGMRYFVRKSHRQPVSIPFDVADWAVTVAVPSSVHPVQAVEMQIVPLVSAPDSASAIRIDEQPVAGCLRGGESKLRIDFSGPDVWKTFCNGEPRGNLAGSAAKLITVGGNSAVHAIVPRLSFLP
jgi:hypothetical protein